MKIIFLDIDGVLNCSETFKKEMPNLLLDEIDKGMVAILHHIVALTEAKVVLSSSWRLDPEWRKTMKKIGIKIDFLDRTPFGNGVVDRGHEVQEWLDKNFPGQIESVRYCCIDDNTDFHADQKLFKTSWEEGLTPELADEIITYLNV